MRSRTRSKRANASSESKLVIAASRSTRSPEITKVPSFRALDPKCVGRDELDARWGRDESPASAHFDRRCDRKREVANAFTGRRADPADVRVAFAQLG